MTSTQVATPPSNFLIRCTNGSNLRLTHPQAPVAAVSRAGPRCRWNFELASDDQSDGVMVVTVNHCLFGRRLSLASEDTGALTTVSVDNEVTPSELFIMSSLADTSSSDSASSESTPAYSLTSVHGRETFTVAHSTHHGDTADMPSLTCTLSMVQAPTHCRKQPVTSSSAAGGASDGVVADCDGGTASGDADGASSGGRRRGGCCGGRGMGGRGRGGMMPGCGSDRMAMKVKMMKMMGMGRGLGMIGGGGRGRCGGRGGAMGWGGRGGMQTVDGSSGFGHGMGRGMHHGHHHGHPHHPHHHHPHHPHHPHGRGPHHHGFCPGHLAAAAAGGAGGHATVSTSPHAKHMTVRPVDDGHVEVAVRVLAADVDSVMESMSNIAERVRVLGDENEDDPGSRPVDATVVA